MFSECYACCFLSTFLSFCKTRSAALRQTAFHRAEYGVLSSETQRSVERNTEFCRAKHGVLSSGIQNFTERNSTRSRTEISPLLSTPCCRAVFLIIYTRARRHNSPSARKQNSVLLMGDALYGIPMLPSLLLGDAYPVAGRCLPCYWATFPLLLGDVFLLLGDVFPLHVEQRKGGCRPLRLVLLNKVSKKVDNLLLFGDFFSKKSYFFSRGGFIFRSSSCYTPLR